MIRKLDQIDRRILAILQDDARTPVAEIARRVKLGETTVRYRIRRLQKGKVITHLTALLNPRAVGLSVTAVILIKADASRLKGVFDELISYEETQHVFQTTGEHDAVAMAHLRDNAHLNELVKRIKLNRGVRDAHVWVATGLIKIDTRLPL